MIELTFPDGYHVLRFDDDRFEYTEVNPELADHPCTVAAEAVLEGPSCCFSAYVEGDNPMRVESFEVRNHYLQLQALSVFAQYTRRYIWSCPPWSLCLHFVENPEVGLWTIHLNAYLNFAGCWLDVHLSCTPVDIETLEEVGLVQELLTHISIGTIDDRLCIGAPALPDLGRLLRAWPTWFRDEEGLVDRYWGFRLQDEGLIAREPEQQAEDLFSTRPGPTAEKPEVEGSEQAGDAVDASRVLGLALYDEHFYWQLYVLTTREGQGWRELLAQYFAGQGSTLQVLEFTEKKATWEFALVSLSDQEQWATCAVLAFERGPQTFVWSCIPIAESQPSDEQLQAEAKAFTKRFKFLSKQPQGHPVHYAVCERHGVNPFSPVALEDGAEQVHELEGAGGVQALERVLIALQEDAAASDQPIFQASIHSARGVFADLQDRDEEAERHFLSARKLLVNRTKELAGCFTKADKANYPPDYVNHLHFNIAVRLWGVDYRRAVVHASRGRLDRATEVLAGLYRSAQSLKFQEELVQNVTKNPAFAALSTYEPWQAVLTSGKK